MYRSLFFISLIFMFACSSKEKQRAAQSVAKMWDAANYSVGNEMQTDTQNGTQKNISLTLENIKGVNDTYPKKYITSLSAFKFLENLSAREIEGYSGLTIILKGSGEAFEKKYKIADLIEINPLLNQADSVCHYFRTGEVEASKKYFDANSVADTNFAALKNLINEIEGKFGKTTKVTITGFEFGQLQENNEPVLIVFSELSNKTSYTNYKFIFSRKLKKIVYLGINEQ